MKYNRFFLGLVAMLLCFAVSAQVDNTAPPTDWERDPVCWNDGSQDSTIFQVSLYVVGDPAPVIVRYEAYDGTAITPGAGDVITPGACMADAVQAQTGIDYLLLELCDDGTPFYRMIRVDESDDSSTSIGDYNLSFSAYTVTGTVTGGPCNATTSGTATISRTVSVTTAGSVVAGKESVSVCNAGVTQVTFTVDGSAAVLYPGECWSYTAYLDPVSEVFLRSPAISWDAAGTVVVTYAD